MTPLAVDTTTVFEIVSEGLGAQDASVGGGRYDGLISEVGGPEVPGIGFAIGQAGKTILLGIALAVRLRTVRQAAA